MQTRDVMTMGVECISPDANLQEAGKKMQLFDVGALPVCEDDRLVGMITDRDIIVRSVAQELDPKLEIVRDAMTPDVSYCFEDQDVAEVADLMRYKQIRRLPVLNHERRLVGIVSLGDLAVAAPDCRIPGQALKGISEHVLTG
jgi:CBS domain-containing protein